MFGTRFPLLLLCRLLLLFPMAVTTTQEAVAVAGKRTRSKDYEREKQLAAVPVQIIAELFWGFRTLRRRRDATLPVPKEINLRHDSCLSPGSAANAAASLK